MFTQNFNTYYSLRITRIITFTCRSMQKTCLMHTFIYDFMYAKNKNFQSVLLLIARIWPECLFIKSNAGAYANPILLVIVHLTRSHIINKSQADKSQELVIFVRLCNWHTQNISNASALYSGLHSKLSGIKSLFIFNPFEFRLNDSALQYLNAFKLLCKYEGWNWSLNVFIMQYIKNLLEKWTIKQHDNEIGDELVAFYLLLQSNLLASMCPLNEVTYVTDCIKSFLFFIKESNIKMSSHFMQVSMIDCLLLLAPYDPPLCFRDMQSWLKINQNQVPLELKTRIKIVFDSYAHKIPDIVISL
jgi:hypothetical protein